VWSMLIPILLSPAAPGMADARFEAVAQKYNPGVLDSRSGDRHARLGEHRNREARDQRTQR